MLCAPRYLAANILILFEMFKEDLQEAGNILQLFFPELPGALVVACIIVSEKGRFLTSATTYSTDPRSLLLLMKPLNIIPRFFLSWQLRRRGRGKVFLQDAALQDFVKES